MPSKAAVKSKKLILAVRRGSKSESKKTLPLDSASVSTTNERCRREHMAVEGKFPASGDRGLDRP